VVKTAWPASEQLPFQRTHGWLEMICLINHNTFRRKQDGTATAGMVQVPPLLR